MKHNSILLAALFVCSANLFTPAAKAQVNVNDSLALVDLYNSTNGNTWTHNYNWLHTWVEFWYGVTVAHHRVVKVALPSNNLTGTLPSSINNLTALDTLDLYWNYITGPIPPIGKLTQLQYLNLATNRLSGTIPSSVGKLANLRYLSFDANQLSGAIPSSIGNLTKLQYLALEGNQLSNPIPSSIGRLTNLTFLNLAANKLSGAIPDSIGNLTNLVNLNLWANKLAGAVPASIGNLTNLTNLDLHANKLSGTVPASLANLSNLNGLNIAQNQLSGAIFPILSHLHNLTFLYIHRNEFTQYGNDQQFIATGVQGQMNYNFFTFDGLEYTKQHGTKITYAPQKTILSIHQNGNTLSVYAGGTLSNNTYHWHSIATAATTDIVGDSTFTPSLSGQYYVTVNNKILKKLTLSSDTINFVVTNANQVINTNTAKAASPATIRHMLAYPNPASNLIHIQTNGSAAITITNGNGKVLFNKTINSKSEINVSAFPNGTYYIKNTTTGEVQNIVVAH